MVSFIYDLSENDREIFFEFLKNMDFSMKNDLFDKIKNQIDSSLFEITNEESKYNGGFSWDCTFKSKQKITHHKKEYLGDKPVKTIVPIIKGSFYLSGRRHVTNGQYDTKKPLKYNLDGSLSIQFTPEEQQVIGHKQGWFSNDEIKSFITEERDFNLFHEIWFKSHDDNNNNNDHPSWVKVISFGPKGEKTNFKDLTLLKYGEKPFDELDQDYIDFFKKFDIKMTELLKEVYGGINKLKNEINNVLVDLDQDNNGQLDFIEGGDDYLTLLKKHQNKIIEIDRTYIQQFIKVSNYLTHKKQNLQVIFERLKDSVNQSQLDELGEILKQEIHTYNIILLNSLHMVNSLVEDDMITFYDIYEKFDKLNMFTSNWENQVTEKLDEVNLNLVELMKELRDVGDRIVGSIDNLSYITEESTRQLTSKMEEIDSTLKVGNLINVIQTYQMGKVNKNTKSLRG